VYTKTKNVGKAKIDKTLFWTVVLLCIAGILAVSNASAPQALAVFGDPYFFAKQQISWSIVGFAGLIVASSINYTIWKKAAFLLGGVSLFLLVAVLVPGLGVKVLGARRWISLGPASFQPSEFAKFGVAVVVARMLDDGYPRRYIIIFIGIVSALVMLQPDLGTTIVIAGMGIAQLFIAGIPLLNLVSIVSAGALITGFLILISDYRRARLVSFLESASDPLQNSYHMRQILIALGSGGIFGVGIGQSRQKHLFLPETASDSIFAVIAEETGLVGSVVIISLLTFFVLRVLKIARRAPDNFSKILGSAIGFWFMGQTFLNLASIAAITPLTGIPLPFFSYGGTSLVMILFATGIILNISKACDHV
jgi:cell division protein FtsW